MIVTFINMNSAIKNFTQTLKHPVLYIVYKRYKLNSTTNEKPN